MLFINEWLNFCKTDLILPEKYLEPSLRWNTHDQAILTVLYKKYIDLGIFNKEGFKLEKFIFSKQNILFFTHS
jgi:hypothetical protein